MLIRKAFRFRLKTSPGLNRLFGQYAGCNRLIWNKALALQEERHKAGEKRLNYNQLSGLLPAWKAERPFLASAPSQSYQQTLKHLDRAYKEGLAKAKGFPKFKKKGRSDSFSFPQGFKVEDKRIFLPKAGWVRIFASRKVQGKPKNLTVSKVAGHWYASIQVELELAEPVHAAPASEVGVDMGIANFATLSTGERIAPRHAFRKLERTLAFAQRHLARKVKFSRNWSKQKRKVERIHHRAACARQDFLHKLSDRLSKSHAVLVLEDLKVRNMSASAKGTVEEPGRNVRAKSGLNKSILDQGWYLFRTQLEYKAGWRGGRVHLVSPEFTSQKCSQCGHVASGNRPTQERFCCQACGHTEHADVNAARNILAAGHAVTACGGSPMGSSEAGTLQEVA